MDHYSLEPAAKAIINPARLSEQFRFALLRNGGFSHVVILDAVGTIRYRSPAIFRLLADGAADISIRSVVHERDFDRTNHQITAIWQGIRKAASWEARFQTRSGSWEWFEIFSCAFWYDNGAGRVLVLFLRPLMGE